MNNLYIAYLHFIWLSQRQLFHIFQTAQVLSSKDFYEKLTREKLEWYWIRAKQIETILDRKSSIDENKIRAYFEKFQVVLTTFEDSWYPEMLKNIPNPPYIIYVRWVLDNSPKLSVVGSRSITSYGKKCVEYFIPWISQYFTVVSGWALWCDSEAHLACLAHKQKTIVIIGTWIDQCYPTCNGKMYDLIVKDWGAIVSIFPFWELPNRYNFPVRNEIVAGLSLWTIVIEAKEKSGSLITARLALENGKDVFACPWEIFKSNSIGCNELIIKWEAKMISKVQDILCEYNIAPSWNTVGWNRAKKFSWDTEETKIYEALFQETLTVDELLQNTGLAIQRLTLKLSMLEIGWYIHKNIGWKYELK